MTRHEGPSKRACVSIKVVGRSPSRTAASFVRPTRTADSAQSFVRAVHQKYATGITNQPSVVATEAQIMISGKKVAEEVGFDKIRAQLAQLHELKIVLVDGLQISCAEKQGKTIRDVCSRITELDLSRNLFESLKEIIGIAMELDHLRTLKLNGNRLQVLLPELVSAPTAFLGIKDLELDEMLLSWEDTCLLVEQFESLKALTASSNSFEILKTPLSSLNLASLTLEYNQFTSLADLAPLSQLRSLQNLLLKGNRISRIDSSSSSSSSRPIFGSNLKYVDLSYNQVHSWAFVDDLPEVFPAMTGLRIQHNPVYENVVKGVGPASNIDDGFMLVLARLGNLKSLNFSPISDIDRRNAEMFYLSRIGKEMATVAENHESTITSRHKRFAELCEIYDKPDVMRKGAESVNSDFLEARLIKFTFHMPPTSGDAGKEAIEKTIEIPKGFDIYRVKGIVGRLFDVKPLYVKLIWDTGEYDPVAGYEEKEDDSSEYEDEDVKMAITNGSKSEDKGKWMKREVEIEDSTRQLGYVVEGLEARVRVEVTQI